MKFEKLNENNGKGSKMFLCSLILGVSLLIVSNLFLTKAKYKVVDSAKLVNSTINYSSADLNVIAMYKNDGEKDELIKEVPVGYYDIDEERSYCKIPDSDNLIKDKITYDGKEVNIKITKKGTKCYVYFISAAANTLADLKLKSNTESDGCPTVDENGIATITGIEDTKKLICSSIDDYGKTYYFRGQADNNWVKIGDTHWRIIRINGNGSLRLIYNGQTTNKTGEEILAETNVPFNNYYNDNKYVGFMYGGEKDQTSSSYTEAHNNKNNSEILNSLYNWWTNNDLDKLLEKIDLENGFCNDREPYGSKSASQPDKNNYGYGAIESYYGSGVRMLKQLPTFICTQKMQDLFTYKNYTNIGNGKLEKPVGLITDDEIIYAGGGFGKENRGYWLFIEKDYWSISPSYMNANGIAYNISVKNDGSISNFRVYSTTPSMRPVINLKTNLPFKGKGTSSNPFEIVE